MRFRSNLPERDIASALAAVMFDDGGGRWPYTVPYKVPFLSEQGHWWELSNGNDRKMDVLDNCEYRFRQRYPNKDLLDRVLAVLNNLGAQLLDISPVEQLARSQKETP